MNNKLVAVVVIVVVIVIAAVAVVALSDDDDDDNKGNSGTYVNNADEKARIYGNANNDSYLNSEDVTLIQKIIDEKLDWQKEYPYADANNDGKVDSSDVTYVQNFIDGKSQLMYYTTNTGDTDYIHYPLSGKIGCNYDYGYMVAQILDKWGDVTAGITRWTTQQNSDGSYKVTELRYPGVRGFTDLGTTDDRETLAENILKSGISIYMGQPDTTVQKYLRAAESSTGKVVDVINLKYASMNAYGTPVSAVMTTGIMFNAQDKAKEYLDKFNSTLEYIHTKTANLQSKTFIQPYNPGDGAQTAVDCLGISSTGYNAMGDYWTISLLPMTDGLGAQAAGNYIKVDKETIMQANPDVMIISMWGVMTEETPVATAQKAFEQYAANMSGVAAYPNSTYGVCFETIGTPIGISSLLLLASYIWPDVFNEDEGWQSLQEWYDEFTEYKGDIKDAGGLIVYKMSS